MCVFLVELTLLGLSCPLAESSRPVCRPRRSAQLRRREECPRATSVPTRLPHHPASVLGATVSRRCRSLYHGVDGSHLRHTTLRVFLTRSAFTHTTLQVFSLLSPRPVRHTTLQVFSLLSPRPVRHTTLQVFSAHLRPRRPTHHPASVLDSTRFHPHHPASVLDSTRFHPHHPASVPDSTRFHPHHPASVLDSTRFHPHHPASVLVFNPLHRSASVLVFNLHRSASVLVVGGTMRTGASRP
ncbi:MAG: hypothetical protein J07HB67_00191 [halophilic archaeon J07HB67]|nr:MAG: hypothetical protein J07HB67_00191 [halophilic archaeon J07HB67]